MNNPNPPHTNSDEHPDILDQIGIEDITRAVAHEFSTMIAANFLDSGDYTMQEKECLQLGVEYSIYHRE